MQSVEIDSLKLILQSVGQEHLLNYYDELSNDQKLQLVNELKHIDWKNLDKTFKEEILLQLDHGNSKLKPVSKIADHLMEDITQPMRWGTTLCGSEALEAYELVGLQKIKDGKVAALVLAGGQGTRLGFDYPKGMYDVGLPENKSLFQLQAERILQLRNYDNSCGFNSRIIWYVMTSEATSKHTRDFFEQKNFFGLSKDEVVLFEQGSMPCLNFEGKVLLDEKFKISRSPDGNGGLYEALHRNGIIDHMESNGVEYVHVYCVDNILVRVCDPVFIGYCFSQNVDVGAKVVEKTSPDEAIGIICKVGQKFKVIEYSEISESVANKRNREGKLVYAAGNICDHFFRVQFLKSIKGDSRKLEYHVAIKKISHVDLSSGHRIAKPQSLCGIKLEKFIFDVFEFVDKVAIWEVKREDEFSPLKNADGTDKNNPTTAREAFLRANELELFKIPKYSISDQRRKGTDRK